MIGWLVRRGISVPNAEDIVGTAFETAMRKQAESNDTRIDPNDNVDSFLFGQGNYARLQANRQAKRETERRTSLEELREANPHFDIPMKDFSEALIDELATRQTLDEVLSQLSETDLGIFLMKAEGHSSREIADMLYTSGKVLDNYILQLRKKIRSSRSA